MATATRTRIHPFTTAEWSALKRCERTLHRWAMDELNGAIRHDSDGQPRRYWPDRYGSPTVAGSVISDKPETAMMRAREIAARHGLSVYHQADPRGCALYVYSAADLKGRRIDECYSIMARAVA